MSVILVVIRGSYLDTWNLLVRDMQRLVNRFSLLILF